MMRAHPVTWCLASVLLVAAGGAIAQTSTVTVEPAADGSIAAPTGPLTIADIEYPLESILTSEQGKVTLRFTTDVAGRAGPLQVFSSSGILRLDQAAAQIARARWQFQPNTTVQVAIDWKLPLEPVPEYRTILPSPPEGATPPKATNSHAVRADDYPALSIRSGERGTAVLHYAVQEDGRVGEVKIAASSGHLRLDDAASGMIKRWTFEPARLKGSPVSFWLSASVDFLINGSVPAKGRSPASCFERPYVSDGDAQETILITGTLIGAPNVPAVRLPDGPALKRWVFLTREGAVADLLIGTNRGFMRMSKPLIAYMAQSVRYPRPSNRAGCWYFEEIPLNR
jgi:TonB family protein